MLKQTGAIFIVRQLQNILYHEGKALFLFGRFGETFDTVPMEVIWWAMRKLGVEE